VLVDDGNGVSLGVIPVIGPHAKEGEGQGVGLDAVASPEAKFVSLVLLPMKIGMQGERPSIRSLGSFASPIMPHGRVRRGEVGSLNGPPAGNCAGQ
jgi:hypothetical protein